MTNETMLEGGHIK